MSSLTPPEAMSTGDHASVSSETLRARLRQAIEHFEHVLPGQAAIKDFVHHNTIHGFEHLPFPEALAAARRLNGNYGYEAPAAYRAYYAQGRITRRDLEQVLGEDAALRATDILFTTRDGAITRGDVTIALLTHPIKAVTGCQLNWQIEEQSALSSFQPDVDAASRARIMAGAGCSSEAEAVTALWAACLHALGLDHYFLHPEELLDLSPEQAEAMLASVLNKEERSLPGQMIMDRLINDEADQALDRLFAEVGPSHTLAGLLKALTGEDILLAFHPTLVRQLAAFLDQGFAPWPDPQRSLGLYAAWRQRALHDRTWVFDDLPDWLDSIEALPEDPLDTLIIELKWLGLDEAQWEAYLERLALELPGWSGIFMWRHQRPGYAGSDEVKVDMLDYLAVRLVLERLYAQRLCRQYWEIEASLDVIHWYLRNHRAEFLVRHSVYNSRLPEYLVTQAQHLFASSEIRGATGEAEWRHLAHMIWTWSRSPAAARPGRASVHRDAWRLFRLAQHLGVCAEDMQVLSAEQLKALFELMDELDDERSGYLWLQAYELHYRDMFFNAVVNNQGRGHWARRDRRPAAQVVFCMDDREEGIRRHLEEHNPAIETLGAAGFFGLPVNWRGLDDNEVSPLCPVVVTPVHEIRETARPDEDITHARHQRRRARRLRLKSLFVQETRRSLLRGTALILLGAPAALAVLTAKLIAPLHLTRLSNALRTRYDGRVPTQVQTNTDDTHTATPQDPRLGFNDAEQVERIRNFLRSIGLQQGFGHFLVMMGHGSMSQNNPHLAAYDCGACSGRHGGPNARIFAAMANRPVIRAALRQHGIDIPDDTWVLGAEHDTCNEDITWYDTDAIPAQLLERFEQLRTDMHIATLGSSQERARRLASAPRNPTPQQALKHMLGRAADFSQARPELGHATNAAAIIGRRSISQGAFFDRRVFLISYDPSQDPQGEVLESILLAVGPVGAGISLEYYFSTVNNDKYGAGSKVTHNVTGLLGVMEGTSSDLRTGLPKQMIEIHEAMRLQILVEARLEVLTAIYQRQPLLQQLIGNGWVHLHARDPDSAAIHVFDPARGFLAWQGVVSDVPVVDSSPDWYRGHSDPLPPALIKQGEYTHA